MYPVSTCTAISFPEPSFPLTSGQKTRALEQPFQAYAIDADCAVKPDGQNSVISKWLLPELSFSDRWSRGTETVGTRLLALLSVVSAV